MLGRVTSEPAAPTTRTCTLVFTDMEGSTRLLARLGDRWAALLARHHEIVREVGDLHAGEQVDTQGDAFFLLFDRAPDAAAFAAEVNRRLADEPWPDGARVRVRIGLHTGTVEFGPTGPVGMDVHKAARVSSAAHGGQVVLTEPTRASLPDAELRNLGRHRLKDVPEPVQLWQLAAPGLTAEFPPLRSLDARRLLLPPRDQPLLGRDDELADLDRLLDGGARLVTVTGPGGAGKTTLAVEAARRAASGSRDGVVFVPLAGVQEVDDVLPAVGAALSIEPSDDPVASLAQALDGEGLLLVLDNLEQVLDVGPRLVALTDRTAGLRLLVTSRAPLGVRAEQTLPLDTLGVPTDDGLEEVAASPAVQLFVARAAAVRPGFAVTAGNAADIAALCRHLDGLPLALELAAVRLRTLEPRSLLLRLQESTALLRSTARDADPRQRSLQATIDWSVDLLPADVRALFSGLGCFAAGWSAERLEQVATARGLDPVDALDALDVLVEHSLVRPPGADGRLRMTVPVRDAARARAAADGTQGEWAAAHLEVYAGLAMQVTLASFVPPELSAEVEDLRLALRTAQTVDSAQWASLVGFGFEWLAGQNGAAATEAEVRAALALPGLPNLTRGLLLDAAARLAVYRGRWVEGVKLQDQAVETWRHADEPLGLARSLVYRAMMGSAEDDVDAWCDEATTLLIEDGHGDLIHYALWARAQGMVVRGDVAAAAAVLTELDALPPGDATDSRRRGLHLHFTADCHLLLGEGRAAVEAYGRALRNALGEGLLSQCITELEGMAQALVLEGRLALAYEVVLGAVALRESLGGGPLLPWWQARVDRDVLAPAAELPDAEREACRRHAQERGPEGTVALGLELSAAG